MTKSRSVVVYGGLTEKRNKKFLWGDGNVLYVAYISGHVCQKQTMYA